MLGEAWAGSGGERGAQYALNGRGPVDVTHVTLRGPRGETRVVFGMKGLRVEGRRGEKRPGTGWAPSAGRSTRRDCALRGGEP